ncbi:MAG: protein phosphatase 2C domain-containing protein [Christensenellaceae bacterium]|jgi:serine/threonine protein phosphatase PrpC|nr:protein phosphatase 2C domain-containing protein [Christensenellaceae bacterium]
MPFELLSLLGLAGLGVLLCLVLLLTNLLLMRRGKRLLLSAAENGVLYEESLRPGAEWDEEEYLLAERPEVESPEAEAETEIRQSAYKADPVFTPLGREEGGAVIGSLRLTVGNAQILGAREEQQDAFAITPIEEAGILLGHGVMAVVCDGMGGLKNGKDAANAAALRFMRAYLEASPPLDEAMLQGVFAANDAVFEVSRAKASRMGTTLSAAAVTRGGLWFVSVGDSHIYLHRNEKLYQLSTDHNYYAELLERARRGEITLEEARSNPERGHLTSYLGKENLEKIDANAEPLALRPGDRIMLATDGLFKTVSAARMQEILTRSGRGAHEELMHEAESARKPRQDNATVVILYIDAV